MCTYNTLSHNSHGYVIQCQQCQHIQIGFGTTVCSYSPEKFSDLCQYVRQCYELYRDAPFPETKCVHFHQASEQVVVVYTPREITQLSELIEQAALLLEATRIINLHHDY